MKTHWWWWLPLSLGVPPGVLAGVAACWLSPQWHLAADCRLDRLLTAQLAGQVNRWTLLMTGGIAVLLLYAALARRCPPRVGTALRALLHL